MKIKKEFKNSAFMLFQDDDKMLFQVGEGDLFIPKQNYKHKSSINPHSFEYNGNENILTGKIGFKNKFTVKRIIVIQMN